MVAATVLSGCGPEEVPGRVSAIEAPDTVQSEERFVVTVVTTGPDACWRNERTESVVSGLTAIITPYDIDSGGTCPAIPVEITHIAELTFARSGAGVIRVRGRDGTGLEHSITVE